MATTTEADEVRALVERWVKAVAACDLDRVRACAHTTATTW